MNTIRYLKQADINRHKWDARIDNCTTPLPYALSWYLDAVAENWDALVLNDYEAVMPLVWLRKFGIKCLYQPYYCQQLGVFAQNELPVDVAEEFLKIARQKFNYIDINLNTGAGIIAGNIAVLKKKNLLLGTTGDYAKLKKGYSDNHRRNIGKAIKAGLHFTEQTPLSVFQQFYLENVNRTKENFKPKHEKIFRQLTGALIKQGKAEIFAATSQQGKLYAAALFVFHEKRMTGIINTSSAAGKKNGASHFVFDGLIQKFAGTGMVIDFEGSSIPSIARFYEGFGAYEETFYRYKYSIIQQALPFLY